jgi:hypothetical protein
MVTTGPPKADDAAWLNELKALALSAVFGRVPITPVINTGERAESWIGFYP